LLGNPPQKPRAFKGQGNPIDPPRHNTAVAQAPLSLWPWALSATVTLSAVNAPDACSPLAIVSKSLNNNFQIQLFNKQTTTHHLNGFFARLT
jgi:hypothetical protein